MPFHPIPGSTFTFYLPGLEDQANAGLWKSSPTIAAGDFTISVNGGAFEALDNTPTVKPTGGTQIEFVLSAAETTAAGDGGSITVNCQDSAGDEWYSVGITLRVGAPAVNVTMQAGEPVAAADADGNIPVVLYGTQPAVEFGQVKITTNVASQGALHIRNNNALGRGIDVYSYLAAKLEGSNRGVQLQGGSNQALFLLSDTAAATVYIEGPTTGGKAIAISSPSDGSSPSNASGVYIETQGGHPGILFAFSDPADALSVINSNQGNWTLDELLTDVLEDTGTTLPASIANLPTDQDVRDAMKLAPTVGAPAEGSVDKHLDDLLTTIGSEIVEGTYTRDDILRIIAAALAGETSGSGTSTVEILGLDGATTRITATVDGNGNRTGMTLDGAA